MNSSVLSATGGAAKSTATSSTYSTMTGAGTRINKTPMMVTSPTPTTNGATSQSDWSRHVTAGQLMTIPELIAATGTAVASSGTNTSATTSSIAATRSSISLPIAVRIIGRLDSFDVNGSAATPITNISSHGVKSTASQHGQTPTDDAEDEDEIMTDAAPSSSPPLTSLGVAILRDATQPTHRLAIDTSLLFSPAQQNQLYATAGEEYFSSSSSNSLNGGHLQFELDHWYMVIGDVVQVPTEASVPYVYVRARICRELDASFDIHLYEETIKLRRMMEAQFLPPH